MSLRRVRAPEWLAGAAGIALLVALLLPWYSQEIAPSAGGWTAYAPLPSTSATAWQAFTVTDVLLALLALAGPALLAVQATRPSPALPLGVGVIGVLCGGLATLLVIARMILQPGPNAMVGLQAGAWIALGSALALLAGGWWSTAAEADPGAPMPHVEVRRAPPAAG
jgi:hypothetical protein